MKGELPKNFHQVAFDTVVAAHTKGETVASRKASQLALEAFTAALPEMLGGSADLTGSNLTNTKSTAALRFDAKTGAVVMNVPAVAAKQGAEDEAKPEAPAEGRTAPSAATSTTACASSAWRPS
jgi:transketolase